jgi:hypothetical protein
VASLESLSLQSRVGLPFLGQLLASPLSLAQQFSGDPFFRDEVSRPVPSYCGALEVLALLLRVVGDPVPLPWFVTVGRPPVFVPPSCLSRSSPPGRLYLPGGPSGLASPYCC